MVMGLARHCPGMARRPGRVGQRVAVPAATAPAQPGAGRRRRGGKKLLFSLIVVFPERQLKSFSAALDGDLSVRRGAAPDVRWARGPSPPTLAASPPGTDPAPSVPGQGSSWGGQSPSLGTDISSPLGMGCSGRPLGSATQPCSGTASVHPGGLSLLQRHSTLHQGQQATPSREMRLPPATPAVPPQIWAALPGQPCARVPPTPHPRLGLPATHTPPSWKIFSSPHPGSPSLPLPR